MQQSDNAYHSQGEVYHFINQVAVPSFLLYDAQNNYCSELTEHNRNQGLHCHRMITVLFNSASKPPDTTLQAIFEDDGRRKALEDRHCFIFIDGGNRVEGVDLMKAERHSPFEKSSFTHGSDHASEREGCKRF